MDVFFPLRVGSVEVCLKTDSREIPHVLVLGCVGYFDLI